LPGKTSHNKQKNVTVPKKNYLSPTTEFMNSKIINYLRIGFTIYLMLLFCVILPAHNHENCETHEECTLCVLCIQPAIADAVFTYCALQAPTFVFITANKQSVSFRRARFYPTRAPPFII
jgi:hypothetical protein